MNYLDETSLAYTIDNVSEALFFGFEITENEKREISEFILSRHNLPYTYANMFAPTDFDLKNNLVLFTGEKIKTNGGKCHTIGEEACRILRKLNVNDKKVKTALKEADAGMQSRINAGSGKPGNIYGRYCCRPCSCALWLNLASGGLNNNINLLAAGLDSMKQHREEKGTWKGFPYFYTLYVLNEIDPVMAREEMLFASRSIRRWISRKNPAEDKYSFRRHVLGEKILEKIQG